MSIARDFAELYTPATEAPAKLKGVSTDVVQAFQNLRAGDPSSCEKYLTLVFIKIYRSHLECCNQSFELRTNPNGGIDKAADPLLFEFNDMTKMFDPSQPIEFIPSEMTFEWVLKNKRLRNDPSIKKEVVLIKSKKLEVKKGKA